MSSARSNFLNRIHVIQDALGQPLLIDGVLTDATQNNRARILRNGLMVVAFNGLEDFFRERCSELLSLVSQTSLRFLELPRDLIVAATVEAMKAAHANAIMLSRQGDDPVPLLQQAAAEVASTVAGPLSLSRFALGYNGSNVTADEIGNILKTLHVSDAWNEVTRLGSRVGLGAVPLRDAYAQGLRLRNQAAHRADTNVQPSELLTFCQQAKAIALGFDILASRAARLLHQSNSSYSERPRERLSSDISIIFVDHDGSQYLAKRENARRALRRYSDREDAWRNAISTGRRNNEAVVERDRSGTPVRWESTDCP